MRKWLQRIGVKTAYNRNGKSMGEWMHWII